MTPFFNKKNIASKKETKKESVGAITAPLAVLPLGATQKTRGLDLAMVLIRPHVTEKATDLSGHGVYVFDINKAANKMHVRQAVEKLYKVKPIKIAVVNGKPKFMKNSRTGRVQTKKTSVKKALVYLKSGDKIEFV